MATVTVNKDTQELLKRIGRKGESYDQIIRRLCRLAKRQPFYEEQRRILWEEESIPLEEV